MYYIFPLSHTGIHICNMYVRARVCVYNKMAKVLLLIFFIDGNSSLYE